jgi:hypothetical protein
MFSLPKMVARLEVSVVVVAEPGGPGTEARSA